MIEIWVDIPIVLWVKSLEVKTFDIYLADDASAGWRKRSNGEHAGQKDKKKWLEHLDLSVIMTAVSIVQLTVPITVWIPSVANPIEFQSDRYHHFNPCSKSNIVCWRKFKFLFKILLIIHKYRYLYLLNADYSTTLRVSANGVSVCTPDTNSSQSNSTLSSITGAGGPEKEQYFWVYTDFYKWSLLSQGNNSQ